MSNKLYFLIGAPPMCGVCLCNLKHNSALSETEAEHLARMDGTPLKQVFHCQNSNCPQFKIDMVINPFEANRVFGFTGFTPIPYQGQYNEPFCGHCGARKK